MLQFNRFSLKRDAKLLIDDANLTIFTKNKVGIVGANGSGKSSLFALLLGQLESAAGELNYPKQLRLAHLAQETPALSCTALDYVLDGDSALREVEAALLKPDLDDKSLMKLHEAYEHMDGYTAPARASSLLHGLGFKASEFEQPVKSFSGGWRMRLNLAQCLMTPSDLLLLDEPTNHLDLEAVIWLERFIKNYPGTLLLISHDRDFLDSCCSHILHFEHQKLNLYTGNYSQFERLRAEKLALQQSQYEKQQRQIAHMQDFVRRFKAKASKAKQAQSRVKALEKMEVLACAQVDSPFSFSFQSTQIHSNPLLNLDNVALGYNDTTIIKKANFSLLKDARIGLLGPNGAGKSTLIKCLVGSLLPMAGKVVKSQSQLKVGYYTQHQLEHLSPTQSAVWHILQLSPKAQEQTVRTFLGSFDFHGDMATKPIAPFSGGEKARLALALIAWEKPNLLLLDEPTNHLDLDMRAALEMALQDYPGAIVLISHDRHLLNATVDEFYLVAEGQVVPFKGELDDYHQWLQNHTRSQTQSPRKDKPNKRNESKARVNKIKKIETKLAKSEQEKAVIEQALADDASYQDQEKLNTLLEKQEKIQATIDELESEWMALHDDE